LRAAVHLAERQRCCAAKISISRSVEQAKEIGTRIIPRPGISACDDSVADHFHYLAAEHVGSRRCKVDAGFSEKPHALGKDLERGDDSIRIALQMRQFGAIRLPQESAPAVLMRRNHRFHHPNCQCSRRRRALHPLTAPDIVRRQSAWVAVAPEDKAENN
jgi:hypothetical protein